MLSVEQHELVALAKQTVEIVPFMTKEACEECIRVLLPHVRDAFLASQTPIPEGLSEKKGMELIEALMQRREGDPAFSKKAQQGEKKPEKQKKNNNNKIVMDAPLSPKATRSQAKKRDRTPAKNDQADFEVVIEELKEHPPKGMGPPRKHTKKHLVVVSDDSNSNVEEEEKQEQQKKKEEEEEKKQDQQEWEDWNAKTHGNISQVVRLGVRDHKDDDPTFGMFIKARKTGSGYRTDFPFFAYGDELKAVDKIKEKDSAKHRRTVQLLLKAVQKHVEKEGGVISDGLRELLQGSQWGQEILAQIVSESSDDRPGSMKSHEL